jgi:hypothetical protein
MLHEFPVERRCTHRYEPFQLRFARHALGRLPSREDVMFLANHGGLVLRGKTEAALERPIRVLKAYYGDQVDVGQLTLRLLHGATTEEPYMGLGILCPREHLEVIKSDLRERDAVIFDEDVTPQFGVIRATAPLAKVLGYAQTVSELGTGASAVIWLSHYGPAKITAAAQHPRAPKVRASPEPLWASA